jgi:hypothetical protein
MKGILTAALIFTFLMGTSSYLLAQSGDETDALNTVGENAQIKKDVFDPGGWGAKPETKDMQDGLEGKGDDGVANEGVFDPGGWGVKQTDITEQDQWDYSNDPSRTPSVKEGIFDPGGWGAKPKNKGVVPGADHLENIQTEPVEESMKVKRVPHHQDGVPKSGTGDIGNPPSSGPATPDTGGGSSGPKQGKPGKKTGIPTTSKTDKK